MTSGLLVMVICGRRCIAKDPRKKGRVETLFDITMKHCSEDRRKTTFLDFTTEFSKLQTRLSRLQVSRGQSWSDRDRERYEGRAVLASYDLLASPPKELEKDTNEWYASHLTFSGDKKKF